MNKKLILILCGFLVVAGFSLGIWGHKNKEAETMARLARQENSVFNRPYSPVYGPASARVRIVEFFDPACETCRAFYPLVKNLVDSQQGRAVKILEAARLQGLFWPVAEAMLAGQPQWADHGMPKPELIWGMLDNTGLNIRKARDDAAAPEAKAHLDQDMADAASLGVTRTPGFSVNGQALTDFGYEQLLELVEQEVKRAYPQ